MDEGSSNKIDEKEQIERNAMALAKLVYDVYKEKKAKEKRI